MAMQYTGHVTMTYPDYIDTATGKTLVCVPGQSYNITPASGHLSSAGAPTPTDGRFSAASGREEALDEKEDQANLAVESVDASPPVQKTVPPEGTD